MKKPASFDRRQLLALCGVAALSPALRLFPSASAALAGRGAWCSVPAALPLLLLYLAFFCRFLAARREEEGLAELSLRAAGRGFGRAALLLLGLWFLLYAAFTLRASAARFVTALFPHSSPSFFIVSLGLVCLPAVLGPPRSLARSARLLLPPLLAVMLLLLLTALRTLDRSALLPLTREDALPILRGALPAANVLVFGIYSAGFFLSAVPKRPGAFSQSARWLVGAALLLTGVVAAVQGNYGAALTAKLSLPFFTLVRNLVFLRSLERMEALIVALWLFPDFLLVSLSLHAAQGCLRLLPGAGRGEAAPEPYGGRWPGLLCGAAAILAALWMAPDAVWLTRWSERIVPAANLAVAFVLLPLIYIVGKKKKRL